MRRQRRAHRQGGKGDSTSTEGKREKQATHTNATIAVRSDGHIPKPNDTAQDLEVRLLGHGPGRCHSREEAVLEESGLSQLFDAEIAEKAMHGSFGSASSVPQP